MDGKVVLTSTARTSWRDKDSLPLTAKTQRQIEGPAAGADVVITAFHREVAICNTPCSCRGPVAPVCPAGLLECPAALYEKLSSKEPGNTGKKGFPVNLVL